MGQKWVRHLYFETMLRRCASQWHVYVLLNVSGAENIGVMRSQKNTEKTVFLILFTFFFFLLDKIFESYVAHFSLLARFSSCTSQVTETIQKYDKLECFPPIHVKESYSGVTNSVSQ